MHQNGVNCDLSLHGYFCTIFIYHRLSLYLIVCICIYTSYHWTSIDKLIEGKKLKDVWSLELKQKFLYRYNCRSFCTVTENLLNKMSQSLFLVKENLFNRQLFEKINPAKCEIMAIFLVCTTNCYICHFLEESRQELISF